MTTFREMTAAQLETEIAKALEVFNASPRRVEALEGGLAMLERFGSEVVNTAGYRNGARAMNNMVGAKREIARRGRIAA